MSWSTERMERSRASTSRICVPSATHSPATPFTRQSAVSGAIASSAAPSSSFAPTTPTPACSKVSTPNAGTIEEVSTFLKASPDRFLKSLLYAAGDDVVLAVVRGDHEINEIKLARALGVGEVALATEEQIVKATGAKVGIGASFALQEAVIILATLLARFRFSAIPGQTPKPVMILTLRPEGGVWLLVVPG